MNDSSAPMTDVDIVPSNTLLLRYTFVVQSVSLYLTDIAVLRRLLPTCRLINQYLPNYMVKRWLEPSKAAALLDQSRGFVVHVTRLLEVADEDLSVYPYLQFVQYKDDYEGQVNLPNSVRYVKLSKVWNKPIVPGMLPQGLQALITGDDFNQPIEPNVLPPSLTHLYLGCSFQHHLPVGTLPSSLIDISIEGAATFDPAALPTTLEHLSMSSCQDVEPGTLPPGLKHLELPYFSRIEPGMIPDSVVDLMLDAHCYIGSALPTSLTHLKVESPQLLFEMMDFPAPPLLTHLTLYGFDPEKPPELVIDEGQIPPTVTHLVLDYRARSEGIPMSVTHLQITATHPSELKIDTIPSSVTHLVFGDMFNQSLAPGVIPFGVKILDLGGFNKQLLPGVIPHSVEHLTFGKHFKQLLDPASVPFSVKTLHFLGQFDEPLISYDWLIGPTHPPQIQCPGCPNACLPLMTTIRSIPGSVTELQCSWNASIPISVGDIPNSVTKLIIGRPAANPSQGGLPQLTQNFAAGAIPASVTDLDLGWLYCDLLSEDIVPPSIKQLKVGPFFPHMPKLQSCLQLYRCDEPYGHDLSVSEKLKVFEHHFARKYRCFCYRDPDPFDMLT